MRKLLLFLTFSIFLISIISASPGTYKQGQSIRLEQTCADCSSINITSIINPDGDQIVGNVEMTKDGSVFNYSLNGSLTYLIGTYRISGIGDPSGTDEIWTYPFEVKGGILGFFIVAFVLFYGLSFYGLKIRNEWITLIGCFGLTILGIYTSFNGIDLYKNDLTSVISYVTIAVGLGLGFQALREITYY